jgi:NNP family nitrate/nitrite transporter-like MFS transporter
VLISVPVLTGSLLRLPLGILTDKFGGRLVTSVLHLIVAVPCFLIAGADSYNAFAFYAFLMGLAGTSFAVGIAWNAAWFPAYRQGYAMGLFGAGNVGASVTKLIGPLLIGLVPVGTSALVPGGWRFIPFLYGFVMLLMAALVWFCTPKHDKRPSQTRSVGSMLTPLKHLQVWRFGLYYVVVFGAYVALSSWLPKYYVDVYGLPLEQAALVTTLFIFPVSLMRPFGGLFSDRFGARAVMLGSFLVIAAASLGLAVLPVAAGATIFTALVVVGIAMGIGKASNLKFVPVWYPKDVGAVGGTVGLLGGLGGWFLPLYFFAPLEAATGDPASIFWVLFGFTAVSILWLLVAISRIRVGRLKPLTSVPEGA